MLSRTTTASPDAAGPPGTDSPPPGPPPADGPALPVAQSSSSEPPSSPQPPRVRDWPGALRRLRARLVVVVMLAGAVFGGLRLAESRSAAAAKLDIGTVTLTADPIPVQSIRSGLIRSIEVHPDERVLAGQALGELTSASTTASGDVVQTNVVLRAPVTGIVTGQPAPVGTVLPAGATFVTMYDPAHLTLVATVPLADLSKIAAGMHVALRNADLGTSVDALVGPVRPRVGTAQSDVGADHLAVELEPVDRRLVAQLVPGLRFQGTVDTQSGRAHQGKIVYVSP